MAVDYLATIALGLLGLAGATIAFGYLTARFERDSQVIDHLIDQNRAVSRPGMQTRDDALLRRMGQRARAGRTDA